MSKKMGVGFVSTANAEIKAKMKELNIRAYEVAEIFGKSDSWTYNKLRRQMTAEETAAWLKAIEEIEKGRRCEKI